MKLDPNNNDAMSSVRDDLGGDGWNGIDRCVYGIPRKSNHIIKYHNPINGSTLYVGEEADI